MDYNSYCFALIKKLVSIHSESQNEEEIANYLYSLLQKMGMQTELQHIDGKSYNIIAHLKGKRETGVKRKLLLGGHIDTVSKNDLWDTDPYSIVTDRNKIFGLGAGDMKGGIATEITALKKIIAEGSDFSGEIEFIGLCDEERYSIGANAYVNKVKNECIRAADFAIFAEPHYDNIVIGAAGKVLLKLDVKGETGHAANPETGINAIDCLSRLLVNINDKYLPLYAKGIAASHCVLRIESKYDGYSLNIPDKCFTLINKQLYTHENADTFIKDVQDIYNTTVKKGILTITKEIPYYPSYKLDQNNRDLQLLMKLLDQNGLKPELRINQSVSDGNILYNELGIPTILFGPQGVHFHKENEYLLKSTVESYINIISDYIIKFFNNI